MSNILSIYHPNYINDMISWPKYRATYGGGSQFVRTYLKPLSKRESSEDFNLRRSISYCPSFAKAAISEIKNAIIQRLDEIVRDGGPKSFIDASLGKDGGVDKAGNSMSSFIARFVIIELLIMGRVGIFCDMPQLFGPTIADKGDEHPYFYTYRAEQIRSWTYDTQNPDILLAVFLEDFQFGTDALTGLTSSVATSFRRLWINEQQTVSYQSYNTKGDPSSEIRTLDIPRIPFVILELSSSLLADVADYQIALLNLESSDLMYALKSNYPFYTEQFDPKTISTYLVNQEQETNEVTVGAASGRRYPIGAERPGFINPSSEPLKIAMEKEEQLKRDIRALVQLSVQNLQPRRASAASKIVDERPLEAGLATVGMELEHAERLLAYFWSLYEGVVNVATVNYPSEYILPSDQAKQDEAKKLEELIPQIPSRTFQKEASKRIVDLTIGRKVSLELLQKMYSEIDSSTIPYSDPKILSDDVESGLVSLKTASNIRGYPAGEVEKAKQEHAEKLALIAEAQTTGPVGAANVALKSKETNGKPPKQPAFNGNKF